MLRTYADSAVQAWDEEALAILAYELLPFRTEPYT
jgi:hypothetical protein